MGTHVSAFTAANILARCGPRKLAKVFSHCLQRKEEMVNDADHSGGESPDLTEPTMVLRRSSTESSTQAQQPIPEIRLERKDSVIQNNTPPQKPVDTEPAADSLPHPSPPPLNPATPCLQEQAGAKGPRRAVGSQYHVLLVDDNKINLQLLVMFMKKCGYTYEEAENGQEALDKFKEAYLPGPHCTGIESARQFDFVLMDISMPVMNGLEATRHIRDFERENELDRTNIIALTGLASADAQRDAKAAGVDVFLPKPVRFAELKKLLTAKV